MGTPTVLVLLMGASKNDLDLVMDLFQQKYPQFVHGSFPKTVWDPSGTNVVPLGIPLRPFGPKQSYNKRQKEAV